MSTEKVRILDQPAIVAKLKRMAFEIYEKNFGKKELIMVGMDERGGYLAQELKSLLERISPLKVTFVQARKDLESYDVTLEGVDGSVLKNQIVFLVDDVLYSGITMVSALTTVMEFAPRKVRIAVLIDRGHRSFPVSPDFVGLELATTLKQHVSVEVEEENEKIEAFLL